MIRPAYAAMIILLLLVTFHGNSAAGCTLKDNFVIKAGNNAPGGQGIPSTGPTNCNSLCVKNDKCVAWTLQKTTNYCWLKTVATFSDHDAIGWISGEKCEEIRPVAVPMSSVWYGYHLGNRELPGSLCIDNNYGATSICHTKGGETWPWVAVEIPRSSVQEVKIFNRNDCCGDRTKNMKVWVGDHRPTTTRTEYSQGVQLGNTFRGPGTDGQVIPFANSQGLNGKYVIVQMSATDYINLAEIKVFGGPATNQECCQPTVNSLYNVGYSGEYNFLQFANGRPAYVNKRNSDWCLFYIPGVWKVGACSSLNTDYTGIGYMNIRNTAYCPNDLGPWQGYVTGSGIQDVGSVTCNNNKRIHNIPRLNSTEDASEGRK